MDVVPAGITRKGTSSGFRKFREALMAKKVESHDNVPVAVGAVSGLFIGSYGAANNFEALKTTGITHVLCVSPSLPLNFPDAFTYLQLQVADLSSVSISMYFDEAFGFIDRYTGIIKALSSGGKVLVHCFMGRSRSATIILAYLIARRDFSLADAFRELRQVRPQAQPNSGFYQELVAFEAKQKQIASSS
ncbi:Protein-tyrosine phosphatase-like [Phytophthora cactorum]|nr:Protein-tyrosine phosphatase-like [Phytophthora cactorum]